MNLALDYHGLYTIVATLRSFSLGKSAPIRFVIDTGAARTIVSIADGIKLGLDFTKLEPSHERLKGVGGSVNALILEKCRLLFTDIQTDKMYSEDIEDYIFVVSPFVKSQAKKRQVMSVPSLLGIDVLRKYTISFSSMSVILEP